MHQGRDIRVGRPAAHDDAINLERRYGEDEEDADIDVRDHPVRIERNDRPGGERQRHGNERREQKDRLVGAGRDDRLLEDEFQKVGEGLEQPKGADDVRAAAKLHGRPDLPVGEQDIGDEKQQRDQKQERLADHDGRGPDIGRKESVHDALFPRAHSAAALKLLRAKAEHSAMTADARAIGFVK